MIKEKELFDRYWLPYGDRAFAWAEKANRNGDYTLRCSIVYIVFFVWLTILGIPGSFIFLLGLPKRCYCGIRWLFEYR